MGDNGAHVAAMVWEKEGEVSPIAFDRRFKVQKSDIDVNR